jgi:hypothetical protein
MGAFIVAGILLFIGVFGWFIGWAIYSSYPAPSVQGDASAPGCWLISCLILAAIVALTHFIPPIGW